MVVLTLKVAQQILNVPNLDEQALPTQPGDLVVLQSLSYKLRVRVERVDGLHYAGEIVECRREGYVGDEIEFDERHIHSRQRCMELA